MGTQPATFWVCDLNAQGELQLKAPYQYEQLEQIDRAAELIGQFAGELWQHPEEFECRLPVSADFLDFRWRQFGTGAGLATLRDEDATLSVSLLVSGVNENDDQTSLKALQSRLLALLRNTGYEPAFALLDIVQRPMVATFNLSAPDRSAARHLFSIADRCFAAAYFRYQRLI
jgi:hypothetical protein